MKIAVMQPYFLPYIGYFQLIAAVDRFVFFDDVNYIKKGWINRNRLVVGGKVDFFTAPLQKASQNKKINEIALCDDEHWKTTLLKTFELNYKRAPHYTEARGLLDCILATYAASAADLARNSVKAVCDYLEIKTEMVDSSSAYNNAQLKGQQRIIDICLQNSAMTYVNPIGGHELYSSDAFIKAGLELKFIQKETVLENDSLSILHLVAHQPKDTLSQAIVAFSLES